MDKKDQIETHRVNYRIAFDAMRAYHVSEIEHKKDMITILNGILISIVTVFAGVFYFILSKEFNLYDKISIIIIPIIAGLYIMLLIRLKSAHTKKINSDHDRYEKFREECRLERDFLGLTAFFNNELNTIINPDIYWDIKKDANKERVGVGHTKTIGIISIFTNMLLYIIVALSIIAMIILLKKIGAISLPGFYQ